MIPTNFGALLVNGVLVPFRNAVMSAKARKNNRSQKVSWESLQTYVESLTLAGAILQKEVDQRAMEAVSGLHDIKTAVNLVARNAEAIVRNLPGLDDYEKIERADPPLKSLLKSVNLLNSRLNMASIVTNPEAAKHGQPRRTPVYKIFHRMVRLFEEEGQRHKVTLRMAGSSHAAPWLFDSFETIPLVLVDNGIKYSERDRDVVVRIEDIAGSSDACVVSVESWGGVVPEEHRSSLFERGFRAPQAKSKASSGSGLGLYIAKIVAEANSCGIKYSVQEVDQSGKTGINVFTVNIRSLDVSKLKKRF